MEVNDRYEIRRKLGQGGAGAVYEGYDQQLRRKVAIKRLLTEDDPESDEKIDQLLKECHSLSALNSPHIVQLYDFGKDEDGPFVVMELLEGETLEDLVRNGPFTEVDFVNLAEQSLEGLLAAHDANILHRDLKPCNFMVTWLPSGRMQLKLLDFGLAKLTAEPSKQTIAHGNSLLGSIYFMAPEQFERLPLDPRTDLYSLGAVFYYTLAGTFPFDGDSVAQVMAGHLTGQYHDLREYRPDLNPEYAKWVMNLMSRDPNSRPESCTAALSQFLGIRQGTYSVPEPSRPSSATAAATQAFQPDQVVTSNTGSVYLNVPGITTGTSPVRIQTGPVPFADAPPPQTSPLAPSNPYAPAPPQQTMTQSIPMGPAGQQTTQQLPQQPNPAETLANYAPRKQSKTPITIAIFSLIALMAVVGWVIYRDKDKEKEPEASPETISFFKNLRNQISVPQTMDNLLQLRDKNADGKLTKEEFSSVNRANDAQELRDSFSKIDTNGDGELDTNELKRLYGL